MIFLHAKWSRRSLLTAGLGLAAGCALPGGSRAIAAQMATDPATTILRSPFPSPVARPATLSKKKPKAWTCETPPASVRKVKGVSKYDPSDKSKSRIDPKREAEHRSATQPVNDFAQAIATSADAVAAGDARPGQSDCAWNWLESWARDQALVGEAVDESVRKWTLAALSSAVIKLQSYGAAPTPSAPIVQAWLQRLGSDVRQDYSRDPDRGSRRNNHLCWAAWACTITGIASGDRSLFDWGMDRYRVALSEVQADGSLPLEMSRGARALGYHSFALGPLVMIAEAGEANGIAMYSADDGRLRRLAGFVLRAFEDPSILATLTGQKQDIDDAIKPSNVAWLEPYYRRTRDPLAEPWLRSMRPMGRSGLGGDLTMLFGAELA